MVSLAEAARDHAERSRFRLAVLLAVACLLVVATITAVSTTLMTRFMTDALLERDASTAMDFVNSVVSVEEAVDYFRGGHREGVPPDVEEFFHHVANLPGVLRANVFAEDRTLLWSSTEGLINRRFDTNDELELAFTGRPVPELESIEEANKDEHVLLDPPGGMFVENYLPIWDETGTSVVGAVEVYRAPEELLASIQRGRVLIWSTSAAAALTLFAGLLGIALYANGVLKRQHGRMLEMERMAVVGEMASAVAHGLRNPLASIRSSAELALEDEIRDDARQPLQGIIDQADRLEGWIRSFLERAVPRAGADGSGASEAVALDRLIDDVLKSFAAQLRTADVQVTVQTAQELPLALADAAGLREALRAVVANSIEAMGSGGGELLVEAVPDRSAGQIRVMISDTGPGLSEEIKARLFQPYTTTKQKGLGVGLPLARRMLERCGGRLDLRNRESGGVTVTMLLRCQG